MMQTVNGSNTARMSYVRSAWIALLILGNIVLPLAGMADASPVQRVVSADFPVVDPVYIYSQLAYLTSHFQRREAGYVAGQGHDRFADYWVRTMAQNLQGFNPQTREDYFFIQGWRERPASLPGFNMEVSIPGLLHPEQEVVIGCHYDGKADSSESAFDDTSGCAYELGVGQALGNYWRSHHLYPARTMRFVIFDAEEQGLFGSFHYLNSTINGDLANITAMFNEEQSGINYPARFLGQLNNQFMPDYIDVTPLQDNAAYAGRIHLTNSQRQSVSRFRQLWSQAVPAVFAQFRAEGYTSLNYYDSQRQNTSQPVFTTEQQSNIHLRDDPSSNSDQVPFIYAGLPVAMVTGDQSYYDPHPPAWAYPYDLPEDTLALMNTYTDGSSRMSPALALGLALPAMLTTWMLNQPSVAGSVEADGGPLAAISDIGQTVAGEPLTLDANAAFDPAHDGAGLLYTWDFGDGEVASGPAVQHIYKSVGNYTLTLTVSSASGRRVVRKVLHVGNAPALYGNPYSPLRGTNAHNFAVQIPRPDNTLPAQPPLAAPFASSTLSTSTPIATPAASIPTLAAIPTDVVTRQPGVAQAQPGVAGPLLIGLAGIALGLALLGGILVVRKRRAG
ncbi:MAG TPA: M28 family peptidase [Ktedonobacteraceae bacterium]|nr:M28 family peptidase [Ktedonobacteraceae bacterium]